MSGADKTTNRAKVKRYKYKHLYGITLEDANRIVESQGGMCAICLVKPAIDLDHDHTTGMMRAFLCRSCNWALGHLGDDPEIVDRAASYLRKYK